MSVKEELDSMKETVKEILEKDQYAKNNDLWLLLNVWKRQGVEFNIKTTLDRLASPETVRRIRQWYNQNGKYLPDDPKVFLKRMKRREEFKHYFVKQ